MYSVKETYLTIQGEGAQAGKTAVFLRFSGCNLWNGREDGRSKGAGVCSLWCDTNFLGTDGENGGKFKYPMDLAIHVAKVWNHSTSYSEEERLVVCTGGEPLLQLDKDLVRCLHQKGFKVAVETNGTLEFNNEAPDGLQVDWICVSPKTGSDIKQKSGDELKLVYPQIENTPEQFEDMDFKHFFLQPKDDPIQDENTRASIHYCLTHPKWRLSVQTHKLLGLP